MIPAALATSVARITFIAASYELFLITSKAKITGQTGDT